MLVLNPAWTLLHKLGYHAGISAVRFFIVRDQVELLLTSLPLPGSFLPASRHGRNALPPLLKLNGGLGFANEAFSIMGELTNTFITGNASDGGNRTLNEAGVTARCFLGSGASLSAGLVLPLEDDTRRLDAILDFGFVARFR